MLVASQLHNYYPSPVLATIGPITIYWYGTLYVVSILVGYWLVSSMLKRILSTHYPLPTTHSTALRLTARLPEFAFGLVLSGFVGARLYHVLNEWSYYWEHPLKIFEIWNGGLAIHGALIGGLIYLWWYSKKIKTQNTEQETQNSTALRLYGFTAYGFLLDLLAPAVLLGLAIGRWGNYFNQELFGYPTNLPWGIPISPEHRPLAFADSIYFHPTFLYESLWDLIGAALLLTWQYHRSKSPALKASGSTALRLYGFTALRLTTRPGFIFFSYLIWISFGRVLVELLRIDEVPLILGWRLPFIISGLGIALGSGGLVILTWKARKVYT